MARSKTLGSNSLISKSAFFNLCNCFLRPEAHLLRAMIFSLFVSILNVCGCACVWFYAIEREKAIEYEKKRKMKFKRLYLEKEAKEKKKKRDLCGCRRGKEERILYRRERGRRKEWKKERESVRLMLSAQTQGRRQEGWEVHSLYIKPSDEEKKWERRWKSKEKIESVRLIKRSDERGKMRKEVRGSEGEIESVRLLLSAQTCRKG